MRCRIVAHPVPALGWRDPRVVTREENIQPATGPEGEGPSGLEASVSRDRHFHRQPHAAQPTEASADLPFTKRARAADGNPPPPAPLQAA